MSAAKWALGILGTYIAGLPGGLLGFWLGSKLDKDNKGDSDPKQLTGSLHDADIALVVLIAAVLKADGVVKMSELNYVKKFLVNNYKEEEGKEILQLLREMVKPGVDIDLEHSCKIIKENTSYTDRYHMMDFLFRLTVADLEFAPAEEGIVRYIAKGLGITYSDLTSMFTRHVHSRSGRTGAGKNGQEPPRARKQEYTKDPYKVLGLTSAATDEEVKKAYRKMAMRYHPDRVDSLGEEMKKNATEQFREISEAYETIKTARGMH